MMSNETNSAGNFADTVPPQVPEGSTTDPPTQQPNQSSSPPVGNQDERVNEYISNDDMSEGNREAANSGHHAVSLPPDAVETMDESPVMGESQYSPIQHEATCWEDEEVEE